MLHNSAQDTPPPPSPLPPLLLRIAPPRIVPPRIVPPRIAPPPPFPPHPWSNLLNRCLNGDSLRLPQPQPREIESTDQEIDYVDSWYTFDGNPIVTSNQRFRPLQLDLIVSYDISEANWDHPVVYPNKQWCSDVKQESMLGSTIDLLAAVHKTRSMMHEKSVLVQQQSHDDEAAQICTRLEMNYKTLIDGAATIKQDYEDELDALNISDDDGKFAYWHACYFIECMDAGLVEVITDGEALRGTILRAALNVEKTYILLDGVKEDDSTFSVALRVNKGHYDHRVVKIIQTGEGRSSN